MMSPRSPPSTTKKSEKQSPPSTTKKSEKQSPPSTTKKSEKQSPQQQQSEQFTHESATTRVNPLIAPEPVAEIDVESKEILIEVPLRPPDQSPGEKSEPVTPDRTSRAAEPLNTPDINTKNEKGCRTCFGLLGPRSGATKPTAGSDDAATLP
eukprot:SAG31_NODE_3125_length_4647_cov_5.148417_3_plen_152_part_00